VPALRDILGQPRALELLARALAAGKLAHAYLFAGPAGVGKRTTALALAAALSCERAPLKGCGGICASCAKIAAGSHPDVLTLAPSGAGHFIVVDDVRQLCAKLAFPPHEGRARVVCIEDADRLKAEAGNALLKTLEEPPQRTHFVLCTEAPDRLLVTIRSRCQRVRFAPLASETVLAMLTARGMPRDKALHLAAVAGGSAGRALELAEGETLSRRRELARKVVDAQSQSTWKDAVAVASEMAADKDELVPSLAFLAQWYRDALATGAAPFEPNSSDPLDEIGAKLSQDRGPGFLLRSASKVLSAQAAIIGFANPQLTLEQMILALRES
jgi:DNA polymerase-3 subunit delta'